MWQVCYRITSLGDELERRPGPAMVLIDRTDRHGTCMKNLSEVNMPDRLLSTPKLLFVIGTRAVLGAGVALLASRRMTKRTTLATGATLAIIGAVTTIPAARIVAHANPSLLRRATSFFG